MPEIAIYQDSKGKGRCRSCGASIEWAETERGKRIPFDGEIVAVRSQGSPLGGRVLEYVDTSVTPSHFQNLPGREGLAAAMRYYCYFCGKSATSELPADAVVRALIVCPECIGEGKIIIPEHEPVLREALEALGTPEAGE
jgi:DNA-directed RNA polymerase subunit RPC12/RpoP